MTSTHDPGPPLPEWLLAPLLDAAAAVLVALEPDKVPPALRPLAAFDLRGLRTPPARRQLQRVLADDEAFRAQVADAFCERREVVAALEPWSAGEAMQLVSDAAERDDLPLLSSALYARRPAGWLFGLGAAAVYAERLHSARDADVERRALEDRLRSMEEARRRSDAARSSVEQRVSDLERELRTERQSRRARDAQSQHAVEGAEARTRRAEAGESKARAEVDAAEIRLRREAQRARESDKELHEARRALAASEQARLEAERRVDSGRAVGGGLRRRDLEALVDAAELARRLADGLGGVVERAQGGAAGRQASRPPGRAPAPRRARRVRLPLPPGLPADSPEALMASLRTPGVALVVDGYNVSMLGWGSASIADQRERLVAALGQLHSRTSAAVTLVFDGSDVEGVRPPRRAGVRVVFSAPGEEADRVVLREAGALPASRPVVVASSDGEVRSGAEAEGAVTVSSATLLSVLRS